MITFICDHPATDDSTGLSVAVAMEAVGDVTGDGGDDLQITLTVENPQADLRGFFFNVNNGFLLGYTVEDLTVTGADITDFDLDNAGGLTDPPQGGAQGSGETFEGAIEFGTPGIGDDDIGSTTFYLSLADEDLSLDLLIGELILIRATSVGEEGGPRGGSSKLLCEVPDVPPPPPPPPPPNGDDFHFNKEFNVDVKANLNFDANVNLDVTKDINVTSNVDLEGNSAVVIFDAQAFGDDTLVEATIFTLTTENMSAAFGEIGSFTG